ncbi:hypothetical protein [Streptomyces sp. PAN_FS17]|uniref:hypothetical protein n=1 Tax=Streptomyces sp. PAN_FS17 TaxID=1855351 RepID=UPI00089C90DD|nr:hypothetical protein [Streptomyces sp. PAN_FS17]SEB60613.1 hypothetical protein SAMN05216482_0168 [Streptomyces sp. PAN_FS17]
MAKAPKLKKVDPFTALESLRASLGQAGIVFPSLRVDSQMEQLIELGRVRADAAMRLADALRREGQET